MTEEAERLDGALNRQRIGADHEGVSPAVSALVDLAVEVAESFELFRLPAADHDRLYADAFGRFEDSIRRHRPFWDRVAGHRGAVIGGAAAATVVTVAAIGIAVVHERHRQRDRRPAGAGAAA